MKYYFTKETKIGLLTIVEKGGYLTKLYFGRVTEGKEKCTSLIAKAFTQLEEYFKGKRKEFDLPLLPQGTAFQKSIWRELIKITYGETQTYKNIAIAIGNPKACRAVGMANNKNPIPIIIPCHRVIGTSGKLTGYAGGLGVKERLLELEGVI